MNNTEIVRMIEMLNQHLKKPKSYYVNGGCLAYAIALQKIIGGQIVWNKSLCHFLVLKNNKYQDVFGNHTSKIYIADVVDNPFQHYKSSYFSRFQKDL